MKYWCEEAWLGGDTTTSRVVLDVAEGRILQVEEPGAAAPDGAVVLRGLTLPGLANAHSHAFHRALRARTQRPGTFWSWREQMYALAGTLTPERHARLVRATYAEMVQCGYTVVGEFHYLHDPAAMEAGLVDGARDSGIRLTLLDALYLSSGFGAAVSGVQRRFADRDAAAWVERMDASPECDPLVRRGAAVHSVRAVDRAGIEVAAAWARAHDAPLHAHVSEQPAENDECLATYGVTPMRLLVDSGAVGDRFTAVHGTHLTAEDVALAGEAGATCCLCPTTERDLADGIGPARSLWAAGARLAIGSDSHAVIDPFEELRAVELNERLATLRRGHLPAHELLAMGTASGYHSLGWFGGGVLRAGALADFVTLRLDSVRLAGTPRGSLLDGAVFAATASDVDHVVIGGRVVVREGRHVCIDVAAELAAALGAE